MSKCDNEVLRVLQVLRVPKVLVLMVLMVLTVPRGGVEAQAPGAATVDPRIAKLVASVSEERMQQLLQKLSSFKTRNTCSRLRGAN